jgi:hypothetical protein
MIIPQAPFAERHLRGLAAKIAYRHHKAGYQHAQRVEPTEEGDDDSGEAVTRRDARLQLSDRSRHLADPGKTGEPAGQEERERHDSLT